MKIHDLQQGSPEWQAFRLNHHGASEAAAMLGLSKKTTRSELLRMKHTGTPKEFSDWVQVNILDYGHEVEAMARPIVEDLIGEDLYPVTCSNEDTGGILSASCDGLTMSYDTAFEHKQWAAELAASVAAGMLPEEHMPQCQQIMLVTGAKRLIFVVSDGTRDRFEHIEVLPDQNWFARIIAGWRQFTEDLGNWKLEESAPEVIGVTPETMPTPFIRVTGHVAESNLGEYVAKAREILAGIKTVLVTDKDFLDAEETVKWAKKSEETLETTKAAIISQTRDIGTALGQIDEIKEELRTVRLKLNRLVKSEKERNKTNMIDAAIKEFRDHQQKINFEFSELVERLDRPVLFSVPQPFFGEAIKGMSKLENMKNALDTTVANSKIEVDEKAREWREKLAWFAQAAENYKNIFHDLQTLVEKPLEDFKLAVESRIEKQKRDEEAKLEADRARIRAEEEAKAKAEAEAKLRAEQQAAPPAVPLTDPAPSTATARPSPAPAPAVSRASPAPAGKNRPTDDEIIDALTLHFRVHESVVVAWLLEIDLDAASQRIADSMAA
ncbi:MAG: YqaJ viral recombinase family protein [Zoogloeaceae bacterium]|jgi:predicted phage-related endonuclease|nr:YqaJ viral recombinase family protein [Zoogloeaceae bacterium]